MKNKIFSLKQVTILPFVLVVFPIINLFLHNAGKISLRSVLPSLAVSLVFCLIIYFLSIFILKNYLSSAIVTSLFVFLFMNYSDLYSLAKKALPGVFTHYIVSIALLVILFSVAVVLIVKYKPRNKKILPVANWISIVLLLVLGVNNISGIKLILKGNQSELQVSQEGIRKGVPTDLRANLNYKPDVYFIILDAYTRSDVLKDFYGYDNSGFTSFLENKGFYVSPNSRSNYTETRLSIPSVLSMEYSTYLAKDTTSTSEMFNLLQQYWKYSPVFSTAKELGYTTVNFTSLSAFGQNMKADITVDDVTFSDFDQLVLQKTLLQPLSTELAIINQRSQVMNSLKDVPEITNNPDPTFTFVHIMSPHIPYVFDQNGDFPTEPSAKKSILDLVVPSEAYVEQLAYTSNSPKQRLVNTGNSAEPPIIIAVDHGGVFDRQEPEERMAIFFAILAPGIEPASLDSNFHDITLVNVFRKIFDGYFNTNFGSLADSLKFSLYSSDYNYCEFINSYQYQNANKILQTNDYKLEIGKLSECDIYFFTPGVDGFYGAESDYRWGKSTVNIQLPVQEPSAYLLSLDVSSPLVDQQTLSLFMNDSLVGTYKIDNSGVNQINVIISEADLKQGEFAAFRFDLLITIASETDNRMISLQYRQYQGCLYQIQITENDIVKTQELILGNGWHSLEGEDLETTYRWADNNAEVYTLTSESMELEVIISAGSDLLTKPFNFKLADSTGKFIEEEVINNDQESVTFSIPDCQTGLCIYYLTVENIGQDSSANVTSGLRFQVMSIDLLPDP